MNKILLATTFLFSVAGTARAADAVVYDAAPESAPVYSVFDWSGAYVGAHIGYGWGDTLDENNPAADEKDLEGVIGGLSVGYNYQMTNNVVVGVEADLSFSDISNEWRDDNEFSGYHTEDEVTTVGTLRARLGYAADRLLIYGTAGLAVGRTNHTLGCDAELVRAGIGSCASDPAREFETSDSDIAVGYAAGGGAEYAFSQNWSLKAEYLYTDLGTSEVSLVDPGFPSAINDREFDTSFSAVRFGVNYRF